MSEQIVAFEENVWPCHRGGTGYGRIAVVGTDELVCYVPDRQMADVILKAINECGMTPEELGLRKFKYQVVVSNIGIVFDGNSRGNAVDTFRCYVAHSKAEGRRASGEDVTMFEDGEPVKEHTGTLNG